MLQALTQYFQQWGQAVLDTALPPLCLLCDTSIPSSQAACSACWTKLRFISKPFCAQCGVPFAYEIGESAVCAMCIKEPNDFSIARAALVYDDVSRNLILNFKHADKIDTALALARWMHMAGGALAEDADFIIPVPLHYWRMVQRRYNQSALLAQKFSELVCKPYQADVLRRIKATESQGKRKRAERIANMKGVFQVTPACAALVKNATIVLVDDVVTTGATVNACAKVLLQSGAKAVHVVSVARTTLSE